MFHRKINNQNRTQNKFSRNGIANVKAAKLGEGLSKLLNLSNLNLDFT